MNQAVVLAENINKFFGKNQKPAIDLLSTKITSGKMTGIVGPDGAGKTTLLRIFMGLLLPTNGTVTVKGFDTKTDSHKIHEISGYMPQKFGLYEDLTVLENLNLYADLRGAFGKERELKFKDLLKLTNLENFQKRLAGNLSGGMKQKLGLACSLIGNPQVLFLDEPSVGVDPISRQDLWTMVKTLLTEGIAIVWSTSYLDEAEKCDNVILLDEGKKLYDGPPADLLENVDGRTWHIKGIDENKKRKTLTQLLKNTEVVDGIIQGKNVRIVTKTNNHEIALDNGAWQKATPCFEDAFIDMLGGITYRQSVLANEIKEKPVNDSPIIEAISLTKKFGSFIAVQDNSFQIKRGEIFGLLGPNGAGKSTTFKMMCGLLTPNKGQALVRGLDLRTSTSKARSHIGYMAQKFSLYGNLSVVQNLQFFSGLYGLHGDEQRHQIELMIEIFAMHPYLNINAQDLPLGFKQRLALACSIMHQPDVLFLDEPTSGVDPLTRREFWMHINAMVEKGVTVMVTTHFMDEAEYCDRIGLIYKGINIATGSPDYLKSLAISTDMPSPTLEDAFIYLIKQEDLKGHVR